MSGFTTAAFRQHGTIVNSIAFLPSLISTGFFLLALGMLYFEASPLSSALEKRLPFELVRDEENARMILNMLAASTISLTVFSFSMVMIVLSQASSNLSPRVIPGLTTDRSNQVVLGFYIGTIIYILLLLLSSKPQANSPGTPVIAILLGLAFGIVCLILFVYFIHTISRAIQVDHILNGLLHQAIEALEKERQVIEATHTAVDFNREAFSFTLPTKETGYLKQVDLGSLQRLARQHGLQLEIQAEVSAFILEGTPLLCLSKDPRQEKGLKEELLQCFTFSQKEVVIKDFEQAVKQISEIAVKALSPGINDPGTALKAIDFLSLLFIRRLKCDEHNCLPDEKKQALVIENLVTLDELLHRYLSPIRTYGKSDVQIIIRLLKCLQSLLHQQPSGNQIKMIRQHILAVADDADQAIPNAVDRERVNNFLAQINALLPQSEGLELLK